MSFAYPPSPGLKQEIINLSDEGVRGIYLHAAPASAEDPPVLLFFFGGAFFGGSAEACRGFVERYARRLGCDAFLASYRLCPESTVEDAYLDACRAYEWLLSRKAPERIALMGLSSGGSLCLRLLQLARAPEGERRRFFAGRGPVPQPAGAVLLGPWVNYTVGPHVDPSNCFVRHQEMDLVVTPRLDEFVRPQMLAAFGGEEGKRALSPLFQEMRGLCPMLVSFSTHEVFADDNRALVARLHEAGNEVEASEQPYLWHAFQAFAGYVPECLKEELNICRWLGRRGPAWNP